MALLVGGTVLALLGHSQHGPWVAPLNSKGLTLHWCTMSKGINLGQHYCLTKVIVRHGNLILHLHMTLVCNVGIQQESTVDPKEHRPPPPLFPHPPIRALASPELIGNVDIINVHVVRIIYC